MIKASDQTARQRIRAKVEVDRDPKFSTELKDAREVDRKGHIQERPRTSHCKVERKGARVG
jgi:hypothetical protein